MAALSDFFPLPENCNQYSLEYIENNSVIKLFEDEIHIKIGIAVENAQLEENLRSFHEKDTKFYIIEKNDLAAYLAKKLFSK